ncbi:MAG: CoA transferase, partial [Ottowia sp.]|nr:CoA transferase [Ottowia sp.]
PDQYQRGEQRLAGREVINGLIADWVGALPLDEVLARCDAAGVPCGHIMDIADIFEHPQYAARGNLQTVQ